MAALAGFIGGLATVAAPAAEVAAFDGEVEGMPPGN
jgi:hypothetical protein